MVAGRHPFERIDSASRPAVKDGRIQATNATQFELISPRVCQLFYRLNLTGEPCHTKQDMAYYNVIKHVQLGNLISLLS